LHRRLGATGRFFSFGLRGPDDGKRSEVAPGAVTPVRAAINDTAQRVTGGARLGADGTRRDQRGIRLTNTHDGRRSRGTTW